MNIKDVAARVAEIQRNMDDDEHSHMLEDNLYTDLLQSIRDGSCRNPKKCAAIALMTEHIMFSRWYA